MSADEVYSVEVDNLSLEFPLLKSSANQIINLLKGKWGLVFKRNKFECLKDLSFKIKKGEVVGIIGPNGAGKSTLLRLLAGVYIPAEGQIKTSGKVALLAGVGAGFQGNLSGRENIYLSGSIYGISNKKLKSLEESIIEFSEIEEFIDQPLKTYSSGMRARLAFSIASNLSPDILLIDEVIAVGDASFKTKSMDRIKQMVEGDATVIIISHSQSLLAMICDRIMCLHKGKIDCFTENSDDAIERYHLLSQQR